MTLPLAVINGHGLYARDCILLLFTSSSQLCYRVIHHSDYKQEAFGLEFGLCYFPVFLGSLGPLRIPVILLLRRSLYAFSCLPRMRVPTVSPSMATVP